MSQIALWNCSKEVRRGHDTWEFLLGKKKQNKKHVVEYQRIITKHKNRNLKVMSLVFFSGPEGAGV